MSAAVAAIGVEGIAQQPSYKAIEAVTGQQVVKADLAITAHLADENQAKVLAIETAMPLLMMKKQSYLSNGVCCDHSVFHIRPERYEFVLSSYFKLG